MYRAVTAIATAGLLCAACSSTSPQKAEILVRTEYSRTAAFSQWKEFRMTSVQPSSPDYTRYPRYEAMVKEALIDELTTRGYERTDVGATDFRVSYELIFRGASLPSEYMSEHDASTEPKTARSGRQTGTLVIKMLDPENSEVLWEGRGSGFRLDTVSPDKQLRKAVWRILVEFPPITG
jgi:hypothetical protein